MRLLALLFATAAGAGRFPVAPGTVGSAIGVGVYLLVWHWPPAALITLVVLVTLIGVWASGAAERHFKREDPGQVIIDEVAGQLVTLMFTGVTLPGVIVGFFLFRVLDIIKPWPANRFERLHGGLGIMADDVMVGVYGNIALQVAVRTFPDWL